WAAGRPAVGEPAAQALRAWCRLAERGVAWRPDGEPVEREDLAALADRRRADLGVPEIVLRSKEQRNAWRRSWHVNIDRWRATSAVMVVHFNRLADGGFLPASYRRLDGDADFQRDRPLLEGAIAAFLEAATKVDRFDLGMAAGSRNLAADQTRLAVLDD